MRGPTADAVIKCIALVLDHQYDLEPSAHLRGQLGIDSLDLCDIVNQLEESFPGITISNDEADQWETISDVIATVEHKETNHATEARKE